MVPAGTVFALSLGLFAARLVQPPEDILRGPLVREAATAAFGRLGFDGSTKKREQRPEEVALQALALDDASRSIALRVVFHRGALLQRFIVENLDLVTKIGVAGGTGNKLDLMGLLWQALGKLQEMGFNGDLEAQVRESLPLDRRDDFSRLVREQWRTAAAERFHKPVTAVTFGEVVATRLKESGELLGFELESAFKRSETSGQLAFYYVTSGLGLSGAQLDTLRQMFDDFADGAGPDPTKEQKDAFFVGVLAFLTPDQQERLIKRFRGM